MTYKKGRVEMEVMPAFVVSMVKVEPSHVGVRRSTRVGEGMVLGFIDGIA